MTNEEKKSKKGAIIALSILSAITIAIFALDSYIFGDLSVFNRTISPNATLSWLYIKIPAALRTLQIITISWFASIVIRWLLKKLGRTAGLTCLETQFQQTNLHIFLTR